MFSRSQSLEIITRQLCLIKCDTWHICHNLLKYSKLLAKHKTPLLLDVRWPSALQRSAAGSAVRVIIVTRTPAAAAVSMVPGPDADTHYTDQPLFAGLWIITGCNFHTKHNLWGARGGAEWPGHTSTGPCFRDTLWCCRPLIVLSCLPQIIYW